MIIALIGGFLKGALKDLEGSKIYVQKQIEVGAVLVIVVLCLLAFCAVQ